MPPGCQARQNKVNQLAVSVMTYRKMWKILRIRNRSAKFNSQEVVKKKGKIVHRKMEGIEIVAQKITLMISERCPGSLVKYLKPSLIVFTLGQTH